MLILTEKPSVAKDFASALGCSYAGDVYKNATTTITNCIGHLFELEEPSHYGTEIPIIPDRFDYRMNPAVEKQAKFVVSTLKAHKGDQILIATDADREGEIIARECLAQAGITDFSRIKRFWVSEALTAEVVKNGIRNAKALSEYDTLAEQGFARQRADWLTGMNFSRYITQAANRKLAVGRVQTAILSAIGERCDKIKNFKSEKYFEHYGVFRPTRVGSASAVRGIYFEADETGFPDNSRDIKLNACIGKNAKLVDSRTEKKIQNPPQLYNLNALQKDAFKYFGYSADKTLEILQSLYEKLKCVSYPRTETRIMGSGNVDLCRKTADELYLTYKIPFLKNLRDKMKIEVSNKHCFNDTILQKEAHYALIPLKFPIAFPTPDQKNIFMLIVERFVTAFLPPHEYEKQTFILDVDTNKFRIIGKKTLKEGWKTPDVGKAFLMLQNDHNVSDEKDNENDSDEEQSLENIDWNNLVLSDVETKEKWTKPPAHFNEASILSFMENPKENRHVSAEGEEVTPQKKLVGLGTAATRHTFIPKLTKYGYIELKKKNIVVTELGETLLKAVRASSLKSLADIAATTDWEERLDENPAQFLSDIKSFVKETVSKSLKIEVPLPVASGILCPLCGKEVRKGKANWYCTGYKDGCKFVLWETVAGAKLTEKDVVTLCSGKQTGIKHCTNKAGKKFDCKFSLDENWQIKFVFLDKKGK